MPDMKPGARRIRKHVEDIILGFRMIDAGFVNLIISPVFLPLFLGFAKVVIHREEFIVFLRISFLVFLNSEFRSQESEWLEYKLLDGTSARRISL
jgi:hypothetical protein